VICVVLSLDFGVFVFLGAADYRNETEVGDALTEAFKTGLVKREDLFITTKVQSKTIQL
jgi:aldehyde reductase